MKKLLTVCAACMVAGMASAQVESQNIVGYMSPDMVGSTFNMYSVPFDEVGGGGISLNDLTGDFVGGATVSTSDTIKIWDATAGGYATYYLYDKAGTPASYYGWWNVSGGDSFDVDYPTGLPAGSTFWLKSTSLLDGAVTVAGEVGTNAVTDVVITGGTFSMVANPYPVAFSLNSTADCDWLGDGATGGATVSTSDTIKIWDATAGGYVTYYLYNKAGTPASYTGWWNVSGGDSFDTDYPTGLPAGTAFWYKSIGAGFNASFKKTF